MEHVFIVRGSMSDPTHIELEQPLAGIRGAVEVVVRPAPASVVPLEAMSQQAWEDAFDAWVQGHDRSVPLPSDESLRREAIYEDRA